jgi:hypothetical protein
MNRRQQLAVAAVIAVVLTLTLGTIFAFADDCAAPGDCSNTAWAVGGGAVAVAIAVAAAAAGWLPEHPEKGLSPECYKALDQLLQRIHATMGRIGELVITRRGAQIERDTCNAIAQAASDMANNFAKSLGIVGDVATYSGATVDYAGGAASFSQAMINLRRARLESHLGAVTRAVQASGIGGAELASIQATAATISQARAGGITMLTKAGRGLGYLSLLASAASTVASLRREQQLTVVGQLQTVVQLKQGEAWRNQRLVDDLTDRIYALDPELTAQVNAYNAKAAECHARPLQRPTLNSMIGLMEGSAPPPSDPTTSKEQAPEAVLPGPPPPVAEKEPPSGCDRSVYDQEADAYAKALDAWKEARGYLSLWRHHVADLEASIAPVEADWQRFQAALTDMKIKTYGSTAVSAGATVIGLLVVTLNPWTCVVLGVISITADVYGIKSTEQYSDQTTIMPAAFKTQLDWLKSRRSYFQGELERRRAIFEAATDNMMDLWRKATGHQNQCAWSVSEPWPNPESPPDILERNENSWGPVTPRACKYQEIGTWL